MNRRPVTAALTGLAGGIAAIAALVGGGTLAAWVDSIAFEPAAVTAGQFRLEKPSPDEFRWSNTTGSVTGSGSETLASHQVTSGDVLELRQAIHTEFTGDNLATELSLAWPALPEGAVAEGRIENSAGDVLTPGGWQPISVPLPWDQFIADPPIGVNDYVGALRLSLPDDHPDYGTGKLLDLGEFTITANQIRHGAGFTTSTPVTSGLWSDSVSTAVRVATAPNPSVTWTVTNLLDGSGSGRVPDDARYPVTVAELMTTGQVATVKLAPEVTDPPVKLGSRPTTAAGAPIPGVHWSEPSYLIDSDARTITVTWRPEIAILINDLGTAEDLAPGDGVCSTGASKLDPQGNSIPVCTLRAALMETNQTAGTSPMLVTLEDWFDGGTIVPASTTVNATNLMVTAKGLDSGVGDTAAWFAVTRANTLIDLQERLGFKWGANTESLAGIYLNAANLTLRGLAPSETGQSVVVVGPDGAGATIEDFVFRATAWDAEHVVTVAGAPEVTIRNGDVSGLWHNQLSDGSFVAVTGTTSKLVIEGNRVTNGTTSTCGPADTSGCTTAFIDTFGSGTTVDGLVIRDNTITNANLGSGSNQNRIFDFRSSTISDLAIERNRMTDLVVSAQTVGKAPFFDFTGTTLTRATISGNRFDGIEVATASSDSSFIELRGGGTVTDLTILDNRFLKVTGGRNRDNPLIQFFEKTLRGSNTVTGNTFQASCAARNAGYAIHVHGVSATATTAASANVDGHLTITENSFDGFGYAGATSTLLAYQIAVDFGRNTFGTCTNPAASMDAEENQTAGHQHALIDNYNYTGNSMMQTWYPSAVSRDDSTVALTVTQAASVSGLRLNPSAPVTFDVYWTADKTAEKYLGSYDVGTGSSAVLSVPASQVPETGYLRVLTHKDYGTSQFSRTIPVPAQGTVSPAESADSAGDAGVSADSAGDAGVSADSAGDAGAPTEPAAATEPAVEEPGGSGGCGSPGVDRGCRAIQWTLNSPRADGPPSATPEASMAASPRPREHPTTDDTPAGRRGPRTSKE